MAIDPNVQVAIVGVFATTITTLGVIIATVLNNRKERDKAASAGVDAGMEDKDFMKMIERLIQENARKEASLTKLAEINDALTTDNVRKDASILTLTEEKRILLQQLDMLQSSNIKMVGEPDGN